MTGKYNNDKKIRFSSARMAQGLFLAGLMLLPACTNSSNIYARSDISRNDARRVMRVVEDSYADAGKAQLFSKIKRDYDISVTKCNMRFLVQFSPRSMGAGFDGGFQQTIDIDTLKIDNSYFVPVDCGSAVQMEGL